MTFNKANALLIVFHLLTAFHLSQTHPLERVSRNPKKLILDTDGGADDAVAILLTLKYQAENPEGIELIAITCTVGNTDEKIAEKNILKMLTIAGRNDIPVYGGAEEYLMGKKNGTRYYGLDGLGDFDFTEQITATIDESKFAAVALTDLVRKYPGEVVIAALGPLTNLALATKLDAEFLQNVGDIFVMGSSVTGIGNESPNVEFNFGLDPQSAFIVMNSTKKPVTLVPWEVGLNYPIEKVWRKQVFGKLNSPAVDFLNKAERIGIAGADPSWISIDAMTVSTILWPEIVNETIIINVTPVVDGAGKGTILMDYRNFTGKPANARVVLGFDINMFKQKLLKFFSY